MGQVSQARSRTRVLLLGISPTLTLTTVEPDGLWWSVTQDGAVECEYEYDEYDDDEGGGGEDDDDDFDEELVELK